MTASSTRLSVSSLPALALFPILPLFNLLGTNRFTLPYIPFTDADLSNLQSHDNCSIPEPQPPSICFHTPCLVAESFPSFTNLWLSLNFLLRFRVFGAEQKVLRSQITCLVGITVNQNYLLLYDQSVFRQTQRFL